VQERGRSALLFVPPLIVIVILGGWWITLAVIALTVDGEDVEVSERMAYKSWPALRSSGC